ncbi:MAG: hypothetical protein AAGD18_04795 [Actinomycetota bacterium]
MAPFPEDDELEIDVRAIIAEEAEAARRKAVVEAGRRRAGVTGAAMAGIMLAISDIYEPREREEIPIVEEAPSDPEDIDTDGIGLDVDGIEMWAPPPDESD